MSLRLLYPSLVKYTVVFDCVITAIATKITKDNAIGTVRRMLSMRPDRWPRRRNTPRFLRRKRPNFFVGFRVTSPDLMTQVEQLRAAIRDACPAAAPCLIDPRTLHVTLCVLRLPGNAEIDQACQVLHSEAARVAAEEFVRESPPQFTFSDWGFFGDNDVLHAKLDVSTADGRRLGAVAERLHREFFQLGFTTQRFRRPYAPHMTVWKKSRDRELINSLNARRELQFKIKFPKS